MTKDNPFGATRDDLVGEVVPPSGPFLVYVSGTSVGGQRFQRVLPGQNTTSNVEVRSASDLTSVPTGRTTAVAFSITNHGTANTFALSAIDSQRFLTGGAIPPLNLAADESRTVTVNVAPPTSALPGTEFAVTLTATAGADANSNSASILLTIEGDPSNRNPMCTSASANPEVIRKVSHKLVPVSIIGVTDADNDPVQIRITGINQDEPLTGSGSGGTLFDATGIGLSVAQVRAERSGLGDGRVYRIAFDATDGKGGSCSGNVKVEVPHDNRTSAPDSGSGINSLGTK